MAAMLSVLLLAMCVLSADAYAQAALNPRDACTSAGSSFDIPVAVAGNGIISNIVMEVQIKLNVVSQIMYNGVINNASFKAGVKAAVLLYFAIMGVLFATGALQITVSELVIRGVKVMIIGMLMSGASWAWFNGYVVHFFNTGTNEIINKVVWISTGSGPVYYPGGNPFAALDNAINIAMSHKMLVTLMAVFGTGPNGLLIGIIMITGLGSFIKSVINAMWVYLMSLTLKALLFGVAPFFIACILFTRTRHLFDGWLAQLVNASLQPIMLFAFFSFFVHLVVTLLNTFLATPVCWTGVTSLVSGAPVTQHWWRFTVPGAGGGWQEYTGDWTFIGPAEAGFKPFPIDLILVIMFLMITELAMRFNAVVIEIAKDISGASTNLSGTGGSIKEWFTGGGGAERPPAPGTTRPPGSGAGAVDSRGNLPGAPSWRSPTPPATAPGTPGAPGAPATSGGLFGTGGLFGPGGRFSLTPPPGVTPARPGAGGAGLGFRPGAGGGGGEGAPVVTLRGPDGLPIAPPPAGPRGIRPIAPAGVGVADPVAELRRRISTMPGGR